ncbi:MAG TPA: hypothetical protein VLK66_03330 [Longimicrobium sp.]|nr:hypothetical protein [Longimicrobium sp.]
METFTHDPDRDPVLSAALRDAYGEVPEPDFGRMRGALMARAELPLARLRREQRVQPARRRFRALVPLAAAAGVAGTALALTFHQPAAPRRDREVSAADRAQVEQILNESLPSPGEMLAGQGAGDDLLDAAIGS